MTRLARFACRLFKHTPDRIVGSFHGREALVRCTRCRRWLRMSIGPNNSIVLTLWGGVYE